jgi:hypothetical protein
MDLTFCIPHYGKEPKHLEILKICIERIRTVYPSAPILVCKTSDSQFESEDPNVKIFDTFVDGSHVIGAIELLLRECKTGRYVLCHDSMFILKEIPESFLNRDLYSLWHFNEAGWVFYNGYTSAHVKEFGIPIEDLHALNKHHGNADKQLNGIFGPAFGGSIEMLKKVWAILNIGETVPIGYLRRPGLMVSERVFSVLFTYLGVKPEDSLNGNIYRHPNVFEACTIPDFSKIVYDSYFYKIWQKRS